jgi:hypothetical protein
MLIVLMQFLTILSIPQSPFRTHEISRHIRYMLRSLPDLQYGDDAIADTIASNPTDDQKD